MSGAPAFRTADTLCLDVAVQVERCFIIIFVLLPRAGRAIRTGAVLVFVIHRARVVVLHVIVFGVIEVLRHYERLVVEFQRVVVVGRYGIAGVPVVGVVRHGTHGPLVLCVGVRVGVQLVGLVRRHRRRRHRAAVLSGRSRRSNVRVTYTSRYS